MNLSMRKISRPYLDLCIMTLMHNWMQPKMNYLF